MARIVRCTRCQTNEAIYALQYVVSDKPTFTLLGYHYRGFRIVGKVCYACAQELRAEADAAYEAQHADGKESQ